MNRFIYLTIFTLFVEVLSENCDKNGIRLYEDMACLPVSTGGPCPTSYNCTLKSSDPKQCVVRGKSYNPGSGIPKDTSGHTCEFGCTCSSSTPKINCPQWGCGDWAGFPPLAPGCYREYTLDACCSTGVRCPPLKDTTTCTVDGVEYKSGEKMFPKDSCWACICQKGFNGKYEAPFCKRRGCDAQVKYQEEIQKYCAGIYTKRYNEGEAKCCPTEWTCHDGSEVIKSGGKKSDAVCKYGNQTLQIGDSFEKEVKVSFRDNKISCECRVPPLVMCFEV